MENTDVRYEIMKSGLKNYQVATMLGVTETTFSRWLRTELPAEKKKEILEAIKASKQVDVMSFERWNAFLHEQLVKKQGQTPTQPAQGKNESEE